MAEAIRFRHIDLEAQAEEILRDLQNQEHSVSIITFGKTGSGKTSIAGNIAGKDAGDVFKTKGGWNAQMSETNKVHIQVRDGAGSVYCLSIHVLWQWLTVEG